MKESLPPLPTEERYFVEAKGLNNLMTSPAAVGRAAQLVSVKRAYTEGMTDVAEAMSPHNRAVKFAFQTGSMAGLRLAWQAHGPMIDGLSMARSLKRQLLSTDIFEGGSFRRAHLVAGEVAHIATKGLVCVGERAGEVIDGWARRAIAETSTRVQFRQGVGFAALLASQIHNELLYDDLRRREQSVHDVDWDAALRNLRLP